MFDPNSKSSDILSDGPVKDIYSLKGLNETSFLAIQEKSAYFTGKNKV
jgi:hypothetical protein